MIRVTERESEVMVKPTTKILGLGVCLLTLGTIAALQQTPAVAPIEKKGLIAHWEFNPTKLSDKIVPDNQGKWNGTLIGDPTFVKGPPTFAMQLNGPAQGVMLKEDVTPMTTGLPREAMTIAGWVRVEEGIEYGGILSLMQDNGDNEYGFVLGYNEKTFTFGLATQGADDGDGKITYLAAKTPHQPGKWLHVAAVYDGKLMRILVNGQSENVSREQSGAILYAKSAPFVIGRYRDADEDYPMHGAIRELMVYNRALDEDEIQSLVMAQKALVDAEPEAGSLGFVVSPYLQMPTMDSMTVMWETNKPSTSTVAYGLTTTPTERVEQKELVTVHEVKLTGLKSGTRYLYHVESVDAAGEKLVCKPLTLMPATDEKEAFSFTLFGDTQRNPIITGKIAKLMWKRRPNFVIHVGDVVDNGADNRQWTGDLFRPSAELFGRVPVMPAIGNHEKNHAYYYQYFSLPKPEYYYRYRYGSIDFFVLDSNKSLKPDSEQYKWLEAELPKSDAKFKICYHHHPLYSSDSDDYGKSFAGPNAWGDRNARNLVTLYEKNNVDIVMNGHIHLYERTWPIREGKVNRMNGVIYLTSGGGGGNLEDFTPTPAFFKAEGRVDFHYCYFTVHQNKLNFKAFDQEDRLFDYFEMTK